MKKHLITLTGALGSGKSSTAKKIASELGYSHFSSGDLFRSIAAERGLTIEEINIQAELEHEIDVAVDERLRQMGNDTDLVIDSRMAFHWIPDSFKVYLDLEPEAAAERIFKHIQEEGRVGESGDSVAEILTSIMARRASERKRYENLYQIDTLDLTPFDLVINTALYPLEEVAEQVLTAYNEWLTH
ncbi:MAG: (d)CMP kinase [Candidatus Paceibacterota bacterium]